MPSASGTGLRFRIGPIPVAITAPFLLVALFLGADRASRLDLLLEWVAVVLVSVLVHELGHATAARALGLEPRIELHGMGGATFYATSEPLGLGRRAAVSLAGPFAGFVLGAATWGWVRAVPVAPGELTDFARRDLLWVNFGWGVLNLLPLLPLDGGHLLEAALQRAMGVRGRRVAGMVSAASAAALGVAALARGWLWPALLCLWFLITNLRRLSSEAAWEKDGSLRPLLEQGWRALQAGDGPGAARSGTEGAARARSREMRKAFATLAAEGWLLANETEEAFRALRLFPPGVRPPPLLEGRVLALRGDLEKAVPLLREALRLAEAQGEGRAERWALAEALFRAGRFAEAEAISAAGFERYAEPDFAYNAACSCARQGRLEEGLAWLRRAVAAGYADVARLDGDGDLAALRVLPEFPAVRARIGRPNGGV